MKRTAVLALAFPIFLAACGFACADETAPRTIRVSASSTVKAAPDRVRVSISVVSRGASAREASENNARASKAVSEKLKSLVRAPGELRTGGYELAPEYDYNQQPGTRGPRLVGYVSTNRYAISSDDLPGIGALIDAAVAAGASQVDSIAFYLDDEEGVRRQALAEAGKTARGEAETVAQSLGVSLGEVLEASSGQTAPPMPMFGREKMAMAMDASAPATELVPGSLDVSASVSVSFAIR